MEALGSLLSQGARVAHVAAFLDANHYLGRAGRGIVSVGRGSGVLVLASPTYDGCRPIGLS